VGKKIEIKVTVRNLVAKGLDAAKRSLARFRSVAGGVMKGVGVAAKGAAIAFGVLGLAIRKAFQFEAYRTQFATLLGSMTAAKARFKELVEISEKTPFTPRQIVEASKMLEAFGFQGKENTKTLLQMGDAAASMDPSKLIEMVRAMGRLKAGASAGIVGEPSLRLLELGIISAETKNKMEEVAKATKSSAAVMAVAAKDLDRFKGGMERLSQTGSGLFSTFLGKVDIGLATFGDSLLELSKETLRDANKAIEDFTKSDKFKDWADKTAAALKVVKDIVEALFSGDKSKRLGALSDIKSIFVGAMRAAVEVLMTGAAAMASIIGEALFSGPNASDMAQARGIAAARGLGKDVTTFQSSRAGITGQQTTRQFTKDERKEVEKIAREMQRKRLVEEQGYVFGGQRGEGADTRSLGERMDAAVADIKNSKNRELMAGMMDGFSDFGITPPKPAKTPAGIKATGGSLSVGDLFERLYGAGGGKPDGSKSKPLNINIEAISDAAKKRLQTGAVEG